MTLQGPLENVCVCLSREAEKAAEEQAQAQVTPLQRAIILKRLPKFVQKLYDVHGDHVEMHFGDVRVPALMDLVQEQSGTDGSSAILIASSSDQQWHYRPEDDSIQETRLAMAPCKIIQDWFGRGPLESHSPKVRGRYPRPQPEQE